MIHHFFHLLVLSKFNGIDDQNRIFNHLLEFGININKLIRLKFENYCSNLSLIIFNSELFRRFLSYGLDTDEMFCLNLEEYCNREFRYFYSLSDDFISNLFENLQLIYRTKNVIKFWKFLRPKLCHRRLDNSSKDKIMEIDKLFGALSFSHHLSLMINIYFFFFVLETPNSLVTICKYEFRKLLWCSSDENSSKFKVKMQSLGYPSFINS